MLLVGLLHHLEKFIVFAFCLHTQIVYLFSGFLAIFVHQISEICLLIGKGFHVDLVHLLNFLFAGDLAQGDFKLAFDGCDVI